jgi:hypothetical protein
MIALCIALLQHGASTSASLHAGSCIKQLTSQGGPSNCTTWEASASLPACLVPEVYLELCLNVSCARGRGLLQPLSASGGKAALDMKGRMCGHSTDRAGPKAWGTALQLLHYDIQGHVPRGKRLQVEGTYKFAMTCHEM